MAPMQAEQNPSQHDSAIAAESSLNLTGWDELGIAAQARDAAMYLAKAHGRNCIYVTGSEKTEIDQMDENASSNSPA